MAWTLVKVNAGSAGSNTITLQATGTGNAMLVAIGNLAGRVVASISDDATGGSNTYVTANCASSTTGSTGAKLEIWYALNSRPGATTLTIVMSPVGSCTAVNWEVSGLSALDVVGVVNTPAATLNPAGPSLTPNFDGDFFMQASFLVSGKQLNGNISSGWTEDSNVANNGWGHLNSTSILSGQAQQATWTATSSADYCASGVAFYLPQTRNHYTNRLGVFSKDAVLSCGAFDMGIPNALYGWYDDDFVAQFDGTTVGATATGIASVPPGVFSKDATLDGLFDD